MIDRATQISIIEVLAFSLNYVARIIVAAHCANGVLTIAVEDDAGELATGSSTGIGLANLRARLATLHGDNASLELAAREPAGVRSEMRLPCAC